MAVLACLNAVIAVAQHTCKFDTGRGLCSALADVRWWVTEEKMHARIYSVLWKASSIICVPAVASMYLYV